MLPLCNSVADLLIPGLPQRALWAMSRRCFHAGVQLQGVLDHSFFYPGRLGNWLSQDGSSIGICVWAPTAQAVTLRLWEGPQGGEAQEIPMTRGLQGDWAAEVCLPACLPEQ